MKRIILTAMLVMLLVFTGSTWIVLNTQWGLDRAHDLVTQFVPGKLSIQSLRGTLRGPIRLFGISYTDDDIDIKLERLVVDWQLIKLLTGTLQISEFDAQGLRIKLLEATKQRKAATPTGIALPFSVDIINARLSHAHISTKSRPPFIIKHINLQASLDDHTVKLGHLSIQADLFDLTTKGQLGLDVKQQFNLETIWTLRYRDYPPINGHGNFNGTLQKLLLTQAIQQPGLVVSLHGQLNNLLETPGWQLTLQVQQLNTQQLVKSWPVVDTDGKLVSKGNLAGFSLAGELRSNLPEQGLFQSTFHLEAKPNIWKITDFTTTHQPTKASLYASGEWRPGPESGSLVLNGGWKQLRLPLLSDRQSDSLSSNKGEFKLNGKLDAYEFTVNTDLGGKQVPTTLLNISGSGNQQRANISSISAATLDGKILGSALVAWSPYLNWDASFTIDDINPATKWRDWPGRLYAKLKAVRKGPSNAPLDIIDLKKLGGKLRGYPVNAHGLLNWSNKKINIKNVDLNIGDSSLQLSGLRNKNWNLQAKLTSPNVNNLWPYSKGKLNLQANVSGPRLTPHIIASINGEKLAFEDYRIGGLNGDFDVDLQSDEQFITALTVNDIAKGSRQWQSAAINADGTRTQHQLKLELRQETDFIQIVVHGSLNQQQVWRGEIAQTSFNLKDFGEWHQTRPAPFQLASKQASLGPWCLTQPGAHVCLQGEQKQNTWNAKLDAKNFPLAMLDNWAPPHLRLHGKTNIDTSLHYIPGHELTGDLLVSIPDDFSLKVADKQQTLRFGPGKIQASLNAAGLDANINLSAYELGDLALRLNLPDWHALSGLQPAQALTGHLTTSLSSLAHLNGFLLDVPDLTGSIKADMRLGGTIGAPLVTGETTINQASADIPALGIKLENINLRAHSKTGSQINYQLSARSGKAEPLTITGNTLLQKPDGWPTKLNIRGDDFEIANLPDVKINISPQLNIEINGRRIDLNGEIAVPHARFRPRALPTTSVSPSQDVIIIDESELPVIEERWKIYSHVRVILGEHVYFDGFGLRGEISGNLLLIDEPGKLTVGQGEIKITEGTYKAYGQDAKIRRGRLMFANTVIDDPGVDLEAVREVDTVTAGVRVRGSLKQPELTLFSEPAMSESDIASYFLLGRPMNTTEGNEGQQLQQALLAARLAGGELFVDQTGIYSYVDELSFEADKTTEQTSLVVGKYLSPKLYVRYVTGIIESSNIVEVHYKLSKYLRIQTEAGYRGSSSVTGADIYYSIEY